jgi:hypothetical protein
LHIVACPDRRITRAALEVVGETVADGQTEVSVLLPRRRYQRFWHRLLHDRTAEQLSVALARLPHANVTFVPFHFGISPPPALVPTRSATIARPPSPNGSDGTHSKPATAWPMRQPARIVGRVHAIRVQPRAGVPTLECTLVTEHGTVSAVFLGRRSIAGIDLGTRMVIDGTIGDHRGRPAILNPRYELLP